MHKDDMARELSPSMEDYLEVIHHLIVKNRVARVRDIAGAMNVKMPSVTGALKKLGSKGLVNYDPHQVITLTHKGEKVAKRLVQTHQTVARFLINVLDIDFDVADQNACRIEHAIDDMVLSRLIKYIEFVENCPMAGTQFVDKFGYFCKHGMDKQQCSQCMTTRLKGYQERD
jgi:DtxR family Mn-dependent transcriptional regulator